MNVRQCESTAKFLYDVAKGTALLTVVSPWVTGQGSVFAMLFGAIATLGLFFWAFWLEGDRRHDSL